MQPAGELLNKRFGVSSKAKTGPEPVTRRSLMPKVLGAAFVVVGLLAWSAVAPAALPQGDGPTPAVATGLQLAHGGGGGAHGLQAAHAREKAEAKTELKKEHDAINQAKSSVSGEEGDDADGAADKADKDDAESGMRPVHHSH
jgi:hypothetical protein